MWTPNRSIRAGVRYSEGGGQFSYKKFAVGKDIKIGWIPYTLF